MKDKQKFNSLDIVYRNIIIKFKTAINNFIQIKISNSKGYKTKLNNVA